MEPRLCAIWIAARERARRLVHELRPVAPPKMRRKAASIPKKQKCPKQLDLFK